MQFSHSVVRRLALHFNVYKNKTNGLHAIIRKHSTSRSSVMHSRHFLFWVQETQLWQGRGKAAWELWFWMSRLLLTACAQFPGLQETLFPRPLPWGARFYRRPCLSLSLPLPAPFLARVYLHLSWSRLSAAIFLLSLPFLSTLSLPTCLSTYLNPLSLYIA